MAEGFVGVKGYPWHAADMTLHVLALEKSQVENLIKPLNDLNISCSVLKTDHELILQVRPRM